MTNKPELERVCIDCGRDLTTEIGVTVFRRKPGRVDTFESTRELLCVEHGKNGANGRTATWSGIPAGNVDLTVHHEQWTDDNGVVHEDEYVDAVFCE